jgi:TIR domain
VATIWITYAWADNSTQDVDFTAQELADAGLQVKLDRWNIQAGKRLWEQIEQFICSPEESDAWLLVATNNSLASEPCREEYAYALDRALKTRGDDYPVIALFLTHADPDLIPAGIRTRLYVSITDPDWKKRVVAATEHRELSRTPTRLPPYYLHVHSLPKRTRPYAIEVRPRAGVWAPIIAAIPLPEAEDVDLWLMTGPWDVPTDTGRSMNTGAGPTEDGKHWTAVLGNQCTPTESCYLWCKKLPSEVTFGVNGRASQQYTVRL